MSLNQFKIDKTCCLPNDATWLYISIEGLDMKRVNQYYFYQLGTYLHPLSEISQDAAVSAIAWKLSNARTWIKWFLDGSLVTMVVSRAAALSLITAIDSVLPENTSDFPSIDPDKKLDWYGHYNITNSLKEFETVFAAELPTFDTYTVLKKGIYSTADLIERAEMAIDEAVRVKLPEKIISDFQQAGRCLALELPTASGFHTMRAVEGVLRIYWRLVVKPAESKKPPIMATCIDQLRKHGEEERLLDILDHIRDLHRNTIMHPEAFLEMKDALRLFDIAKSAISVMGDRINALQDVTPST
jgi:hypothetical protein